jgi:hypothetical protein
MPFTTRRKVTDLDPRVLAPAIGKIVAVEISRIYDNGARALVQDGAVGTLQSVRRSGVEIGMLGLNVGGQDVLVHFDTARGAAQFEISVTEVER